MEKAGDIAIRLAASDSKWTELYGREAYSAIEMSDPNKKPPQADTTNHRPEDLLEYPPNSIELTIARVIRAELRRWGTPLVKRAYNIDEAAVYLGCSEGTVYNLEKAERLHRLHITSKPQYDKHELDKLFEETINRRRPA